MSVNSAHAIVSFGSDAKIFSAFEFPRNRNPNYAARAENGKCLSVKSFYNCNVE